MFWASFHEIAFDFFSYKKLPEFPLAPSPAKPVDPTIQRRSNGKTCRTQDTSPDAKTLCSLFKPLASPCVKVKLLCSPLVSSSVLSFFF
jgi:hypothetical protein